MNITLQCVSKNVQFKSKPPLEKGKCFPGYNFFAKRFLNYPIFDTDHSIIVNDHILGLIHENASITRNTLAVLIDLCNSACQCVNEENE